MAEEVERIPQHRHCGNCGKAHVNDGRFCSETCKEKKTEEIKGKRRKLLLIWVVCAAVGIGAILLSMGGFL